MATDRDGSGLDATEMLESFRITKVERRSPVGGAWVWGTISGHRFEALVFPEPAMHREWEVGGDSRISKMWLKHDGAMVFNWDRGPDIEPRTPGAGLIVELLAEGLADAVFDAGL